MFPVIFVYFCHSLLLVTVKGKLLEKKKKFKTLTWGHCCCLFPPSSLGKGTCHMVLVLAHFGLVSEPSAMHYEECKKFCDKQWADLASTCRKLRKNGHVWSEKNGLASREERFSGRGCQDQGTAWGRSAVSVLPWRPGLLTAPAWHQAECEKYPEEVKATCCQGVEWRVLYLGQGREHLGKLQQGEGQERRGVKGASSVYLYHWNWWLYDEIIYSCVYIYSWIYAYMKC